MQTFHWIEICKISDQNFEEIYENNPAITSLWTFVTTDNLSCATVLSYERNRWKFEHGIRSNMGKEMKSSRNDKYFEIWTFYT